MPEELQDSLLVIREISALRTPLTQVRRRAAMQSAVFVRETAMPEVW